MPEDLTLEQCRAAIDAATARAAEMGVCVNVAIVDRAAHLQAFSRMDGAPLGSIDIACRKARTAALMRQDTAELARRATPGGPVYGIEVTNGGLVVFGGGVLATAEDGAPLGAVGVSGASVEEDIAAARAGVDALDR